MLWRIRWTCPACSRPHTFGLDSHKLAIFGHLETWICVTRKKVTSPMVLCMRKVLVCSAQAMCIVHWQVHSNRKCDQKGKRMKKSSHFIAFQSPSGCYMAPRHQKHNISRHPWFGLILNNFGCLLQRNQLLPPLTKSNYSATQQMQKRSKFAFDTIQFQQQLHSKLLYPVQD